MICLLWCALSLIIINLNISTPKYLAYLIIWFYVFFFLCWSAFCKNLLCSIVGRYRWTRNSFSRELLLYNLLYLLTQMSAAAEVAITAWARREPTCPESDKITYTWSLYYAVIPIFLSLKWEIFPIYVLLEC